MVMEAVLVNTSLWSTFGGFDIDVATNCEEKERVSKVFTVAFQVWTMYHYPGYLNAIGGRIDAKYQASRSTSPKGFYSEVKNNIRKGTGIGRSMQLFPISPLKKRGQVA
jgi:hypothetical protein